MAKEKSTIEQARQWLEFRSVDTTALTDSDIKSLLSEVAVDFICLNKGRQHAQNRFYTDAMNKVKEKNDKST